MADDWQWFWASEQGRDRILRDELEGLQAQSARASAQSSRLNSQLAHLSGSIESRLSALSSAFDAYVELGDVREQLAGYPDTAAIRRDTAAAIDQLSRSGSAPPVDARGVDYWLPHAVNAVAALVQGHPDLDAERRAVALDRDAEMFLVAAAGALGRGEQVADRLPDLLVCDEALSSHQVALWRAACAGVFGRVLNQIRTRWELSLARDGDMQAWRMWLHEQSGSDRVDETLRWLDQETERLTSESEPEPAAGGEQAVAAARAPAAQTAVPGSPETGDPRAQLRIVVSELVARGMPGEVELLSRARELRARIEDPHRPQADAPTSSPAEVPVVDAVRSALADSTPGSVLRHELLPWVSGPLAAAVSELVAEAEDNEPVVVQARTPGGTVVVRAGVPLAAALVRARENVEIKNAPPTAKLYGSGAIAAGFAVLALVALLLTDSVGLPVVLLVSAGVAAAVSFVALRERTAATSRHAEDLSELDSKVQAAVGAAETTERDRQRLNADLVRWSETLRVRLGSAQAGGGLSAPPRSST